MTERKLTAREREVLSLAGGGLTGKQIAQRLWLAPSTVGCHLDNVRSKLRVQSTREAVRAALDAGLIPVNATPSGVRRP